LMMQTPIIRTENLIKIYQDGTVALRGVSISIRKGEIVGLLGENGAGKTTLVKILAGILKPTDGKIYVNGNEVRIRNSKHALDLGIGLVQQHFSLIDNMTVLENIILGKEESSLFSTLKLKRHRERIQELIEKTGLQVPLDVEVGLLPVGLKQRVEILKVLYKGVDILILDEPTTFLTPHEVNELFTFLRKLVSYGKTVVFISHKIKEVLSITDRIIVMRNGKIVKELPTKDATPEVLASLMIGEKSVQQINQAIEIKEAQSTGSKEPVMVVRNLRVRNDLGVESVRGVSFELFPGEIFGVAGVEGNGQDELVEAIVGMRPPIDGEIIINGEKIDKHNPILAYSKGVSYIPGDRDRFGIILQFNVKENTFLSRQWEREFLGKLSSIKWSLVSELAKKIVERFKIVAPSINTLAKSLSGGNRQRLLVGRELTKKSKIIIAVHPTRGLDIASTEYIQSLLLQAKKEGRSVFLVSADLDEVLKLSDRIAVMYEGKFLAVKPKAEYTLEEIGLLMGGIKK